MRRLIEPTFSSLCKWLKDCDLPAYRARQIRRWLFEKRACSFEEMTDLPKSLRDQLADHFQFWSLRIAQHKKTDDGTEKLLIELADKQRIECVLLREGLRRTICISTQVGCAMGCVFCASGLDGLERNLSAAEILEQILLLQRLLAPEERLSHIVVMGVGEPLANLDSLLPVLEETTDSSGLGISARRITISTVGLPAAIDRLAREDCQYHLAVSLHAPDDTLRNQLVPVNRKTGLRAILQAAHRYFESTGRRITFEYVLLAGVNDQPEHAQRLVKLLRTYPAMINVIPYNPVAGLPYQTPSPQAIGRFEQILQQGGINVQVRQRKGVKIDAACGQLRHTSQALSH